MTAPTALRTFLALGTAAGILVAASATGVHAQAEHPGKATYDRWCLECHGAEGRGDGSAAATMLPRPRDFTQARYQIRTTASGALPTDADLERVLERGMPGTAMPAWPRLSTRQSTDVIAYIKTFSPFFESEGTPAPLELGSAPRASDERVAEGRRIYDQLECWKCHGAQGRGDGTSAPTQEDDNGHPIRPANLAQNWHFNGGGTVEDIYARLRTGLDGTPMPSFSDMIESNLLTEDQLWNLALFVRSLSPEKAPRAAEVIRVRLTSEALPETPDDSAWARVEPAWIPLVGQIIARPRWFAPTVTGVWVQGLHNDREIALRLAWDDPSRSPDPAWDEWRAAITAAMEPDDGPPASGGLPDAFAVQFVPGTDAGRDLPYFLNGDARSPVYLWSWNSTDGVREERARGITSREPLQPDAAALHAQAAFADGRWTLVLRRAVTAQDTVARASFPPAQPLPVAFFAWDGSSGEAATRGAISSWYYLHLEQPVTAAVYLTPVIAAALAAVIGILLVMRAQRQHQRGRTTDHA